MTQSHSGPRQVSLLQRLLDRLATWLQRLPAATSGYTVDADLPVLMRDGVELLADVYTPLGQVSGTLLVRSPYGWGRLMATMTGGVYASRGYRMVLVRCRGTFGSGGEFDPLHCEVNDGADTVAWMRKQPWFDGSFATFGGSYLGFTQWALLVDPPLELKTALICIAPHDFHRAIYRSGAFNLGDFLGWAHQLAHQEDSFFRRVWHMLTARHRVSTAAAQLPMADAGEKLLKGRSSWYRDWISRRDPGDPYWEPMNLSAALDAVQVPVLLQAGWQDIFLDQMLEQYARLRDRGIDVGLTVGPWTHTGIATEGRDLPVRETLDWLGEHLHGDGIRRRAKPVRIFVTGAAQQWRDLDLWPPATTDHLLYLDAGGGLAQQPAADDSSARFVYDPARPTPTVGGPGLFAGGYCDDSELAAREDTLSFTGGVLTAPLEVIGNPVVSLAHSTDNPHADLYVRLSEVAPDGVARNVSEGFLRLNPDSPGDVIRLELDAIAHRFAAGNRVRLVIAGGSHPHWERNLGVGEDPATSSSMRPSRREIRLASSYLQLPVAE